MTFSPKFTNPFFLGYRNIWNILRSNGVCADRKTVMEIIRELEPEKFALRRKKRLLRRIYSVPGPRTKTDTMK